MSETSGYRWFKGNTHAHTTNSDGDSDPEVLTAWYKDHGYNFLAITDHNFYTDIDAVSYERDQDFILIPGNEISVKIDGRPAHVNALNVSEPLPKPESRTVLEALQRCVDAIRAAGGVPHINHPNFRWAFSYKEISQITSCTLFELYNGSTSTNNFSAGGELGHEELWDRVLSAGHRLYGIADDDTHHLTGEFNLRRDNPGRGWVMVRAQQLTPEAIVQALDRGDFYASTEVILTEYEINQKELSLRIRQESDFKYTTVFIGEAGKALSSVDGNEAQYEFTGKELYVRAKVYSSDGGWAWTQPVFLADL
ncbi:CehA/McbA family metallohydrolase [bacterium]|nr:CehA/McbA family metallohydrolase [bacterium]